MITNKLYIMCGIPFSGKSYLADAIVGKLGCKKVDLDEIKFDLFGGDIKDGDLKQTDWDNVYREMYQKIKKGLLAGETVLNDTGNFTKHERGLVRKIADKIGLESITIYVDIPIKVAKERLLENRKNSKRFDVSDGDFESTVKEMEVPDESEKHIIYKLGTPVDIWIKENFS